MATLLLINPNTSPAVTGLLQHHAQSAAGTQVQVQAVTARFGAPYIACEASYAVAGHAVLDAWAAARAQAATAPLAVLIGCFGDPGLWALREASPAPVTGLAEAAFAEASALGRFAVVTGGLRWRPMLQRLAQALGHGGALAGIHAVAPSGAQLAADPDGALALLAAACREAASQDGVRSVILGGAGLAGLAARIQPMLGVPVIDSVLAGIRHALALAAAATPGGTSAPRAGFDVQWQHLSPEMTAIGRPGQ
ncbi:Hydantoin racemase [Rubrivivax sp. A210]|uniref:aspartate/glutamate racemase family protein n=1 Tax=Rubrivivax sp. A210 TaxID=2772301 RepID=UPI00191B18B8|nr:aspartate/glutamate racemase family protein [Rubrivivax sp. A210]CAD5374280.1 Hydantoin racemase [Rubrivivax sp. A210]